MMNLGVLYYIKAQCLKCSYALLVPYYEDGLDRNFACDMCSSVAPVGTKLEAAELYKYEA